MKQIILMALILILGISCKNDKDTEPNPEFQLISGPWYLESENGTEVSACEKKSSIEFTEDNRWLFSQYDEDCELISGEGTFSHSGNSVTISFLFSTVTSTYSISGGILTVNTPNPDTGGTDVSTFDKTSG